MKTVTKVAGGIALVGALTLGGIGLAGAQQADEPVKPIAPVSAVVEEPAPSQAPEPEVAPEPPAPAPEPVVEEVVEPPAPPARMSIPSGGTLPRGANGFLDTSLCESSTASLRPDGSAYCE